MSLEERRKKDSKESSSEEKNKALNLVLGQIERNFGRGSIMRLGDASRMKVETISTGALTLDLALGGGYPKGRVVEVYGPESSGKTTLATHIVAESQKKGGNCAFIDAEHALDPAYAKKLGVNLEELLISQPDTGEQGLEIVSPEYFYVERRINALKQVQEAEHAKQTTLKPQEKEFLKQQLYGTVGCVALDLSGNLAAGTSTGGMTNKKWNKITKCINEIKYNNPNKRR